MFNVRTPTPIPEKQPSEILAENKARHDAATLQQKESKTDKERTKTTVKTVNHGVGASVFAAILYLFGYDKAKYPTPGAGLLDMPGLRFPLFILVAIADVVKAVMAGVDLFQAKNRHIGKYLHFVTETVKAGLIVAGVIGVLGVAALSGAVAPLLFVAAFALATVYNVVGFAYQAGLWMRGAWQRREAEKAAEEGNKKIEAVGRHLNRIEDVVDYYQSRHAERMGKFGRNAIVNAALTAAVVLLNFTGIAPLLIGTASAIVVGVAGLYAVLKGIDKYRREKRVENTQLLADQDKKIIPIDDERDYLHLNNYNFEYQANRTAMLESGKLQSMNLGAQMGWLVGEIQARVNALDEAFKKENLSENVSAEKVKKMSQANEIQCLRALAACVSQIDRIDARQLDALINDSGVEQLRGERKTSAELFEWLQTSLPWKSMFDRARQSLFKRVSDFEDIENAVRFLVTHPDSTVTETAAFTSTAVGAAGALKTTPQRPLAKVTQSPPPSGPSSEKTLYTPAYAGATVHQTGASSATPNMEEQQDNSQKPFGTLSSTP